MKYQEIKGDLIEMAMDNQFDVIAHGCNCFVTMGAGIAPQMANTFQADSADIDYDLDIRASYQYHRAEKLGNIVWWNPYRDFDMHSVPKELTVVNAYTQYSYGRNHEDGVDKPLDYEALTLCMRKMNFQFAGKHIGLPKIGCGLAGGNWDLVKEIIKSELKDCDITIVIYNK